MTQDELIQNLAAEIERARGNAARTVGAPIVLALESMGYRIVPVFVVDTLNKVLAKAPDSAFEEKS